MKSKTKYQYSKEQIEYSTIFKALGHPARVAIFDFLASQNKCICGDIVDELPLAQPTVSKHLKELKNAKLIEGEVEGNAICYCIDVNEIERIIVYFENIVNKLKQNKCC